MRRFDLRRPLLRSLFAAAVAALVAWCAIAPSTASAQNGPGIYYSYEKAQLGNTAQWVLVPHTLKGDLSGDLETDARAAFQALRSTKPPTYGGTSINIDPADLKKGKVSVQIDSAVQAYALIIEAEVVHTMAALGIEQVVFTGAVSETLTVADVPFAAFVATVPLWRALPPATLEGGMVRLPSGDLTTVEGFQQKLATKDSAAVKAVFSALQSGPALAKVGILERLPALGLDKWQDEVVKRLKDDAAEVRLAAVGALKGTRDKDALEALVAVIDKDSDANVQAAAAGVLSATGDKKYGAYGIYFALRGQDKAAALTAIDELVKQRVDSAADELVKAMSHPDKAVGARAARALGELNQDRALRQAIGDEKIDLEIREEAALALAALSDKDAAFAGRSWLAARGSEAAALEAIARLAATRDPEPHAALAAGLDSPHRDARIASARALATLKEDDSLKAMAIAAGKYADERVEIEDAMVDLLEAAETLSNIEDRLKSEKNAILKRATYRALGRKAPAAGRSAAVRDKLVAGLDESDEQARGGALIGLAADPSDDNMTLISARGSDASAQVRADVALALASYPAGKATDVLLQLARDTSSADVAIAAIRSFGVRSEFSVVRDLVKLGKDDPRVRIALVRNLPLLVNNDTRSDVVAYVSNLLFDGDRTVKLAAIESLGQLADDQSIGALALLVQDPDQEIQFAGFNALAATRHASAVPLIAKGLESADPAVRRASLQGLAAHGGSGVREHLEKVAGNDPDAEIKDLAQRLLAQVR